jgi:integrase
VRTIERRLSALRWNFAQRREPFDRADRHVATVLAGIRRTHGRPPEQKEALLPEHLPAMIAGLSLSDLRGLRPGDPARRLRRRPAPLGNRRPRQPPRGWAERGLDRIFRRRPAPDLARQDRLARGRNRPRLVGGVVALQTWLKFARIAHGPLFRRVLADGKSVGAERLTDKHVARLVKRTPMAAGVRADLAEGERERKFSGHSLRAGLASSAEVDERYVQKQLGHVSAEMTRRGGPWPDILADLNSLTETEQDGKRFLLRSALRPAASPALRAAGVVLPPPCGSSPRPDPNPSKKY